MKARPKSLSELEKISSWIDQEYPGHNHIMRTMSIDKTWFTYRPDRISKDCVVQTNGDEWCWRKEWLVFNESGAAKRNTNVKDYLKKRMARTIKRRR